MRTWGDASAGRMNLPGWPGPDRRKNPQKERGDDIEAMGDDT